MIQASDLRIGNWVYIDKVPHKVHDGAHIDLYCDDYEPIPLTPEILEKAGFRIDHECNEYQYNLGCEITLGRDEDNWFVYEIKMDGFAMFKYLHQLQNLFFCLTYEELTINV